MFARIRLWIWSDSYSTIAWEILYIECWLEQKNPHVSWSCWGEQLRDFIRITEFMLMRNHYFSRVDVDCRSRSQLERRSCSRGTILYVLKISTVFYAILSWSDDRNVPLFFRAHSKFLYFWILGWHTVSCSLSSKSRCHWQFWWWFNIMESGETKYL